MKSVLSIILLSIMSLAAPGTDQIVKEFDAVAGGLLQIDLETGGEVEITGWDRNQVRVEAEARGRDQAPGITINRTDRGVEVKVEFPENRRRDFKGQHTQRVHIVVKVPLRFDLQVESMGGDITIDGVEGDIEGETMGGELRLSHLKGDLEISTMGGGITLTDSDVDGKVSTMGGPVLLENVTGDVDGSSMGGSVIYKNVRRADGSSTGA